MKYVKLLTGELIPIEDEDDDNIHRVRDKVYEALEVSPKEVYIQMIYTSDTSDNEDSTNHIITHLALLYPRSQYLVVDTMSLRFGDCLQTCVNESILSYLVEKNSVCEWPAHLFANPHPRVVEHLISHFDSTQFSQIQLFGLAKNPSDDIISHPQWQTLLTTDTMFRANVCINPNVKAIVQLVELLRTLPKASHPSVGRLCHAKFDIMVKFLIDAYGVETLLRCGEFLLNFTELASRIRLQYIDLIQHFHGEYEFNRMCTLSDRPEWEAHQQQYVRTLKQRGTLEIFLPDVIRTGSPSMIAMCVEEIDMKMLCKIPWFSTITEDSVVEFFMERPRSICWPHFLLNRHPRAVQKSLEWLRSKKYQSIDFAEICVIFPEIQSSELIECVLTECRDIQLSSEIQMQLASRSTELRVLFV